MAAVLGVADGGSVTEVPTAERVTADVLVGDAGAGVNGNDPFMIETG